MIASNPKTIDFLTLPENVESTLEILSLREAVYGRLLNDFWKLLLSELKSRSPASVKGDAKGWDLDPGIGRMDALGHSGANSGVTPHPGKGQSLLYRIQQHHRLNSYHLFFGLVWSETLENKGSTPTSEAITAIRAYHQNAEFNMQGDKWYCGWTHLFPPSAREDFLAEFASQRVELTEKYADRFWTYVADTNKWVGEANRSLRANVKPTPRKK